jgi:hypothetical protein
MNHFRASFNASSAELSFMHVRRASGFYISLHAYQRNDHPVERRRRKNGTICHQGTILGSRKVRKNPDVGEKDKKNIWKEKKKSVHLGTQKET